MIAAVVVAAGQGLRMGGGQRKQYLPLCGKPVLTHTLEHFSACSMIDAIVVVLPREALTDGLGQLSPRHRDDPKITCVPGGESRQASVFNGLKAIDAQEGIVLIHDGVRPLISESLIASCIQGARRWHACIPAIAVADTLKQVDHSLRVAKTISRRGLWMAQTPQAFDLSLIRSAHEAGQSAHWPATDDASLVERMGLDVHVIPGLLENIKITTPEDLGLAEAYLSRKMG